jgi:hypothetical protein
MQGLYYLAMLIGVVWLAVWSVLPPEQRRWGWWPFDMRADAAEGMGGARPATDDARASPTATPRGTDQPTDRQPPLPQASEARSWRARREQSKAPPRGR